MRVEGGGYRIAADQIGSDWGWIVAADNVHVVADLRKEKHWILLELPLFTKLLLQLFLLLRRRFRHMRAGFD